MNAYELIDENLYIDWGSPQIDFCFEYDALQEYILPNIRLIDLSDEIALIENIPELKSHFSNKSIETNINIIDRFIKNKNIDITLFESHVLKTYNNIFKKHLKPKPNLLAKINNNVKKFHGKTIGIQLRMGDSYMKVGSFESLKNNDLNDIFKSIRKHQEFESIFLTSDNQYAINKAYEFFNDKNIIYDNEKIKHTDRMDTNNEETLKVLSDILTLSKADYRYISLGSNIGRVSNLISATPSNFKVITRDCLISASIKELIAAKKISINANK